MCDFFVMPVNPIVLRELIKKYGVDKIRSAKDNIASRREQKMFDRVSEKIANQRLPGEIKDEPLVPMEQEIMSYTDAGDPMQLYEAGQMAKDGKILPAMGMAALTLAPQALAKPAVKAIENGVKASSDLGNLKFIRNIGGLPEVGKSGGLTLAPQDNIFGNFTTDVPFRLHPNYSVMPGGEVLLVDPSALRGKTPWNIDPMDTFFRANELVDVDPGKVTLLTGNEGLLDNAEKLGIKTKTSQGLIDKYSEIQDRLGTKSPRWSLDRPRDRVASPPLFRDYRDEIDRLITDIGRPDKNDYEVLEKMTGLRSGTSPDIKYGIDDISDAITSLKSGSMRQRTSDRWITFPDGRSFDYYYFRDLANYLDNPPSFYKNVYYNPFPTAEDDLLRQIGGHGGQKYDTSYDDALQYLFENYVGSNPLKSSGGSIHIKPENRGKFTALLKRTGKTASWYKAHGTPAQKKMAVFALNSKHWSHKRADGGYLQDYGQSYELGGVYDLSEEQVQELIRQGYEVERI